MDEDEFAHIKEKIVGNKNISNNMIKQPKLKNPKTYFCPDCLKTYCFSYGLKRHMINVHNVPRNININDTYKLVTTHQIKPSNKISTSMYHPFHLIGSVQNKMDDIIDDKIDDKIQNKIETIIQDIEKDILTTKQIDKNKETLLDNLICPITQEIFHDPVTTSDGITYERKAITIWLSQHNTSPLTRIIISKTLYTNHVLKNIIEIFLKENPKYCNEVYKDRL